ncbi:MAG: hypothetical protein Q9204_003029 [Flavoplaca sp. TL-2023a]
MSTIMSSLPVNSSLYEHYLTLSDHLIQAIAICMIDKLSNEDTESKKQKADLIRSSGKAHTLSILKRTPELELGQNSVLYEISEKLKLAITYRKQAQACYEENPGKFHNNNKGKKKTSHLPIEFAKKGQHHGKGKGKVENEGKRHQKQIRIMEKSLEEVMKTLNPEPIAEVEPASTGERVEVDNSWSDTDYDESEIELDWSAESSGKYRSLFGGSRS